MKKYDLDTWKIFKNLCDNEKKVKINNNNNNNNNNNWNLYSAISIHKMFKSAAHCHSLSHSQQRLNRCVLRHFLKA